MATKRQVFYSFHYDNDVFRVQQVRNMGFVEGNPSVSNNAWEEVKRGGDSAIKRWIDDAMYYRSCVIVLIGHETSSRKWVQYEISKAWNEGKGLFGIYIDDLIDPRYVNTPPLYGKSYKGFNPFDNIQLKNGNKLSNCVKCYTPPSSDAYNFIAQNLSFWIETAIAERH